MKIFLAVTTILSLGVLVFAEPPGYNYNAPSGGSDFSAGNVGGGGGGSSGGHAFVIPIPVPSQSSKPQGPQAPYLVHVPEAESDGPPTGPAPILIKLPPAAPSGKQLPQIIKLIQTPAGPRPPAPQPVIKLISFGTLQSGGIGGSGGIGPVSQGPAPPPSNQISVIPQPRFQATEPLRLGQSPARPPSAQISAISQPRFRSIGVSSNDNQAPSQAYRLVPIDQSAGGGAFSGSVPPPSSQTSAIAQSGGAFSSGISAGDGYQESGIPESGGGFDSGALSYDVPSPVEIQVQRFKLIPAGGGNVNGGSSFSAGSAAPSNSYGVPAASAGPSQGFDIVTIENGGSSASAGASSGGY